MNNKRATKRALLTSVMALVMCVVMLVGTTFAWFTDTASTGVNKIQAGNLDVDIIGEDGKSLDGKSLSFVKAGLTTDAGAEIDPNATTEILWEPGCRYLTQGFKIANKGNLALKWKAVVNKGTTAANEGNFDLLDVIDFYLVTSKDVDEVGTPLAEFTGNLKKTETSSVYYIKGVMKTTAGNDYQGLTLDGITITVYATQYTYEKDSFDDQYDANAAYKGSQEFTSGTHVLNKGGVALATDARPVAVFATGSDTNVTITGGYYDGGSGGEYNIAVWANGGANVTIKDGTFTVGADKNGDANSVIYSTGGNIVIEGGFFYTNYNSNGFYYVLNQQNGNPGTITVKGGTFVNYDPSTGDDNLGGNFVPAGYSVISETKANGDVWYTVVKGTGATVGTQEDLNSAITNNETSTVKLTTSGTYTLPSLENRDVTIIGTKDTVINLTNAVKKANSVTFDGVTVNFGTDNYKGFQHTSPVVYKDCTINGFMTTYGDTVFESCTFNSGNDQYSINFYGGKNFTLTNCHFYGVNKNVYIYQETLDSDKNVTFTDCDFHMSATEDLKSAVMLNSAAYSFNGYKYNVVINNCTAEGARTEVAENVQGNTNYQGLYGLKHSPLVVEGTVTINGTTVYTH